MNINNGERFTNAMQFLLKVLVTKINGAAARKAYEGDLVIIVAYVNIATEGFKFYNLEF